MDGMECGMRRDNKQDSQEMSLREEAMAHHYAKKNIPHIGWRDGEGEVDRLLVVKGSRVRESV